MWGIHQGSFLILASSSGICGALMSLFEPKGGDGESCLGLFYCSNTVRDYPQLLPLPSTPSTKSFAFISNKGGRKLFSLFGPWRTSGRNGNNPINSKFFIHQSQRRQKAFLSFRTLRNERMKRKLCAERSTPLCFYQHIWATVSPFLE